MNIWGYTHTLQYIHFCFTTSATDILSWSNSREHGLRFLPSEGIHASRQDCCGWPAMRRSLLVRNLMVPRWSCDAPAKHAPLSCDAPSKRAPLSSSEDSASSSWSFVSNLWYVRAQLHTCIQICVCICIIRESFRLGLFETDIIWNAQYFGTHIIWHSWTFVIGDQYILSLVSVETCRIWDSHNWRLVELEIHWIEESQHRRFIEFGS